MFVDWFKNVSADFVYVYEINATGLFFNYMFLSKSPKALKKCWKSWKSEDTSRPRSSIFDISTEESPGDQKRFAVTQHTGKKHQLTLVRKTRNNNNNNNNNN